MRTSKRIRSCDDVQLDVLLLGDETSAEFRASAEHLETCSNCQQRLSQSAAADSQWSEIVTTLRQSQIEGQIDSSGQFNGPDGTDALKTSARQIKLDFLAPPSHPEMLGRLGQYEIEQVIGSGGMGIVLKAFDAELHRPVAIKVLAPHLAHSGAARHRFAREARAAASVVHENVVAIHTVADNGSLPYFVMPYLGGASLQKRIDGGGPLGVMEILRVSVQIAAGLSAAHVQGLVHRDIKPANILLEDGVERLKITDFGLARAVDDSSLTRTGVIAGTPQFMSPEQARGEMVDFRSDLFSLAGVMYAMCTGRAPFRAESTFGTLQRICDATARPIREINPEIPEWLAAFIGRLHEKDPNHRFQTAHEVLLLLEQCLAHLRQPDAVPLPVVVTDLVPKDSGRFTWGGLMGGALFHRNRRTTVNAFSRRRTALLAIVWLASVALVAWIIVHWWPYGDAPLASAEGRKTATLAEVDPPPTGIPLPTNANAQTTDPNQQSPASILAALASDHGYALPPEKVLIRVPPPFDPLRLEYFCARYPSVARLMPDGPSAMVFRSKDGQLKEWRVNLAPVVVTENAGARREMLSRGYTLENILIALTGATSLQIEGPKDLLNISVAGDWVIRDGTGEEEILKQLATTLHAELGVSATLEFREVNRPVYVARGNYRLKPVAGKAAPGQLDKIEVFGKKQVGNPTVSSPVPGVTITSGAPIGGAGNFDRFLDALGQWIGSPIVSDVKTKPRGALSWQLHAHSPQTEESRAEDHDPELVLANVTAQAGLTFNKEQRAVKILFVEPVK